MKAFSGVVETLKSQPTALVLFVTTVILLALFAWTLHILSSTRKAELEAIFAAQKETNLALSKCVEPGTLRELLRENR